ncbi:hypothetical protein FJ693_08575 [Georgenia yuyongxinii]|uniref:Uncharacterized protein n=1 Tax=Georgenia yuyongxinii TaxID=2589797 RepID=A0A552WS80_9MICO|nr:hypothetical protein [Georgenia yuyongxinii]TRW45698.1 hypothetical protein FJ693_08575 [Georgenia yuyongxinii]
MTADEEITDKGRAFREEIGAGTAERERSALDALRDDLLDHLDPWSETVIDAGSYPKRRAGVDNVGGGPHFGSRLTIDHRGGTARDERLTMRGVRRWSH